MTDRLSKRLRARIRELAAKAHEREVEKLLEPLAEEFVRWQAGQKDAWALLEAMNQVAKRCRQLDQQYQGNALAPMNAACAIVSGLIREDEIPSDVLEVLEGHIAFYRRGLADER